MRLGPFVPLVFLAFSSQANTPEGFENKGDVLIIGGRDYSVLRSSRRNVAFMRPGAAVPVFSRRWNLPGSPFSTRSKLLRPGRHMAHLVETDSVPPGARLPRLDSLLAKEKNVAFTRPVYFDPGNNSEFTVTNRITVRWDHAPSKAEVDAWIRSQNLLRDEQLDAQTFSFELSDPLTDPLARSASLSRGTGVEWAEPELLFEMRKHFTPNDPMFPNQWSLRNTAQNGLGTAGADVKADSAWNIERGDPAITVAILDDGVETTHPDLAANIRAGGRNYSGVGNFNDPNPSDPNDRHGTAVAGITAAVGSNGIGPSGVAPNVKILPIKLSTGNLWASSTAIAQAFRWAADTLDVDVLSNSWGLSPASNSVRDAIRDASVRGRSPGTNGLPGLGSLVFVSSGNDASDFESGAFTVGTYAPSGSYRIGFRYAKNGTGSFEDRMCLENVSVSSYVNPGLFETFSGGIPAGWDNNGTPSWIANDTLYFSGSGDLRSVCSSAPLAGGGISEIRLPLRAYDANDYVQFLLRRSTQANDVMQVRLYNSAGALVASLPNITGALDTKTDTVSFPASADSALAVGSSSEFDFRSGYSQFSVSGAGKTVDFLAPSSGVWKGVASTDRSGSLGYDPTAYTGTFGGTSAACPLAAGIGALVLSRYPTYTRNQALDLLRRSSDKIGGVTYTGAYAGGTHREYGYGRLNAFRALSIVNQSPVFTARPDTTVNENQFLQFTLTATDADGDPITYALLNALTGDTLIGNVFQWTPGFGDAGTVLLRFTATDGAINDTDTVAVTVINVDRPPVVNAGINRTVNENQAVSFTVSGTDPDGDAVTLSALNPPSGASFIPGTGAFSWTPDFSQSGSYSLRFRGASNSLADTDTVVVTVNNVDQPPVVDAGADQSVAENQALGFTVTATDPDGGTVTLGSLNLPAGASFTPATGAFAWTPGFTQSGSYPLRFRGISGSLSDTDTVLVTVNNTDRPPVVNGGVDRSVNESQALSFAITSSDPDGDAVTLSLIGAPAGASLVGSNFSWTPDFSQSGTHNILIRGLSNALADTDTVVVTVNNVDQPPTVNAGADFSGDENQALSRTVTGTDMDGDGVTLSALNLPSGATFTPATGAFDWTPDFTQAGVYALRFRGVANALSDTDTVLVTVNNVDRAPTVNAGSDTTVAEGQALALTFGSTDPDGDGVALTLMGAPSGASLTGSNFTWTPDFSQAGIHSIIVRGQSNSLADTDTVVVTVNNVDAPPVVNAGVNRFVNENALLTFTVTGTDPDGDAVTLSALNLPTGATFNPGTGGFSWTPTSAQAGSYSLRFRGTSNALADTDTVVVTVSNLDQPPEVDAGVDRTAAENQALSFSVTATDPDLDSVTLNLINAPTGASFSAGVFSWTPDFSQAGNYSLRFRGTSQALADTDTVVVTVNNVDRAPSVVGGVDRSTGENQPLTFTVTGSDPDGDAVTLSALSLPAGASFTPATGQFSWTPTFAQAGNYPAIFRGTANSLSDSDTVFVTVTNTDRPPAVDAGADQSVDENQALAFSVNAADPEGDSVTLSILNPPSGSGFSGGIFSWTPSYTQAGAYALRFRGVANSLADTDTVVVTVNGLDAGPTVDAGADRGVNETQLLAFTVTASDPDGDAITLSALNLPSGASFTPATGAFAWTPGYTQAGSYSLRFRGVANALADTDTVVVDVGNTDRAPTLISSSDTSLTENQFLIRAASGTDPDGDSVVISTGPLPPGAVFNAGTFSWTPGYADSGLHTFRFYARSGSLADSDDVFIYVANVDRPPALDSIRDTSILEGLPFSWVIFASDPDGDSVRYTASSLPSGATFSGRTFSWTPQFTDSGLYQPWFGAISPAGDTVNYQFDIATPFLRVLNNDRPPTLTPVSPQSVQEGDTLLFSLSASDLDGDAVVISAKGLPTWASFDGSNFIGTPGYNDSGPILVSFVATSQTRSDTEWVSIHVADQGTGLGRVRLIATAPGADFLALSAGPGASGFLGRDSVDIPGLVPGWYSFAARRNSPAGRPVHFSVRVFKDSLTVKRVSLKPSIPIGFAPPETLLVDGSIFGIPDSAALAFGDLNGDGKEDLFLSSRGSWVMLNTDTVPGRDLGYAMNYQIKFPGLDSNLRSASFTDWNFDGFLDLIAASAAGEVFAVYGSDSGFTVRQNLVTRTGENLRVFAEDWDMDGRPDLWIQSPAGLFVHRNMGSVSNPILDPSSIELRDNGGASLAGLRTPVLLDLNGDGIKDLVYSNGTYAEYRVFGFQNGYRDALPPRLLNVAGRALYCLEGCRLTVRIPESGMPRLLVARPNLAMVFQPAKLSGDIDGDGRVDAADRDALLLRWNEWDWSPGWSPAANVWVEGTPEHIDIKDFAGMADSWGLQE